MKASTSSARKARRSRAMTSSTVKKAKAKRILRNRAKIRSVANGRPRLSVFRSSKNISAQIIDDAAGRTIASASSLDKAIKGELAKGADKAAAAKVGKALAERAIKAGVKEVIFDRGGYMYHGRVKALADAAREAGLSF
ncbi:MAG: 50S ribosomal protein L18 [Parvularculaceae bacterium]|nr:50S ribosomal protein L18 [Parvularculaceae bacterium]